MSSFFNDLFAYHQEANQRILQHLTEQTTEIPEKVLALFSHILNAHQMWNNRITAASPLVGVWQMHSWEQAQQLHRENYQQTLQILQTQNLDAIIHYTNSQGKAFQNQVRDILFHIVNHGSYHRGQIATLLRQAQIEPIVTDYIFYKR